MTTTSKFIQQAREELPGLITGVLEHRLQNATVYYVAHNLAAGHHRTLELRARIEGRRARAWWHALRAMTHRQARRRFGRLVEALDRRDQCKGVLACLER